MNVLTNESPRQSLALLERAFPAAPAAVAAVRSAVARLASAAGLRGDALDAVVLATSEAATNAVRHAYPGGHGQIELVAGVSGSELWVLVADHGRGLRRPSPNPGLGRGLALMAASASGFAIAERAAGGTEVRLRFDLPAPGDRNDRRGDDGRDGAVIDRRPELDCTCEQPDQGATCERERRPAGP